MKIQYECIPCLIKRIVFEAQQSTNDSKKIQQAIKAAIHAFSTVYDQNTCSADIATIVHKAAYEKLDDSDPYKQLKQISNQVALSLVPTAKKIISSSCDPLSMSILCSIVGNTLDFGIDGGSHHPDSLFEQFQEFVDEGFGYNDTAIVKEYLKKSSNILYFTDNCGEIVFDKLVLEEIKKHYDHCKISLVVKGTAVLSDATKKDAEILQMNQVVDEILDTGGFAVGMDFVNIPKKVNDALDTADFIICKGMANYEVFSEQSYHPIAYFLRTKCQPIASSMGVDIQKNIVKVYP